MVGNLRSFLGLFLFIICSASATDEGVTSPDGIAPIEVGLTDQQVQVIRRVVERGSKILTSHGVYLADFSEGDDDIKPQISQTVAIPTLTADQETTFRGGPITLPPSLHNRQATEKPDFQSICNQFVPGVSSDQNVVSSQVSQSISEISRAAAVSVSSATSALSSIAASASIAVNSAISSASVAIASANSRADFAEREFKPR